MGDAASGEGGGADEGGGGFGGFGGDFGGDFSGDIGGLETGFDASDDPNDSFNADPNIDLNVENFEPTIDPAFGPDVSPGQMTFDNFMNDLLNTALRGPVQDVRAEDIRSNPYNTPFSIPAATREALAREEAAYAAQIAPVVDPTISPTADPYGTLNLGFTPGVVGDVGLFGPQVGVNPASDGRAEFTSYVTSPDSVITNSYGLTAPSSDLSFLGPAYTGPDRADVALGPYGNLNLDFTPGVRGDVGKTFSGRMVGDEEPVAPQVSEPRELTINKSFPVAESTPPTSVTRATPSYDITTYGVDPYETVSGTVQQGGTPSGVDGTPDGGGENVRRPLTEEEIQYLADMGYMNEGGGASTPTVRPAVAPIQYDISKFVSGIGSLATSGNRT